MRVSSHICRQSKDVSEGKKKENVQWTHVTNTEWSLSLIVFGVKKNIPKSDRFAWRFDYKYIYIYIYIYIFIYLHSTCTCLAFETEFLMAAVNDLNSMTIAIDSSFLGTLNSLLLTIIFVDCYCYYW